MIRKIKLTDQDAFNRLGKELKEDFAHLYHLNDILNNKYQNVYVDEIDGLVVAFLHYEVIYEDLSIINIVVDPKYRNQEIASSLMEYLFNEYPNYHYLLEVRSDNVKAIGLYEKYHFKVINQRKKYYGDVDALVMERR